MWASIPRAPHAMCGGGIRERHGIGTIPPFRVNLRNRADETGRIRGNGPSEPGFSQSDREDGRGRSQVTRIYSAGGLWYGWDYNCLGMGAPLDAASLDDRQQHFATPRSLLREGKPGYILTGRGFSHRTVASKEATEVRVGGKRRFSPPASPMAECVHEARGYKGSGMLPTEASEEAKLDRAVAGVSSYGTREDSHNPHPFGRAALGRATRRDVGHAVVKKIPPENHAVGTSAAAAAELASTHERYRGRKLYPVVGPGRGVHAS